MGLFDRLQREQEAEELRRGRVEIEARQRAQQHQLAEQLKKQGELRAEQLLKQSGLPDLVRRFQSLKPGVRVDERTWDGARRLDLRWHGPSGEYTIDIACNQAGQITVRSSSDSWGGRDFEQRADASRLARDYGRAEKLLDKAYDRAKGRPEIKDSGVGGCGF